MTHVQYLHMHPHHHQHVPHHQYHPHSHAPTHHQIVILITTSHIHSTYQHHQAYPLTYHATTHAKISPQQATLPSQLPTNRAYFQNHFFHQITVPPKQPNPAHHHALSTPNHNILTKDLPPSSPPHVQTVHHTISTDTHVSLHNHHDTSGPHHTHYTTDQSGSSNPPQTTSMIWHNALHHHNQYKRPLPQMVTSTKTNHRLEAYQQPLHTQQTSSCQHDHPCCNHHTCPEHRQHHHSHHQS